METGREDLVSPTVEVPVVEGALVTAIRELRSRGWGSKAIARELSVARNTVRRYLRGAAPGVQVRPTARCLSDAHRATAQTLFRSTAEGNAVVVQRLLAEDG
jgi:predicted transcriptional regulator